ncbi:hypothetical protein L1887_04251 [Cichorium endivia]|nr:hypothetical protein L1887_04251 [Cichorium endivia]
MFIRDFIPSGIAFSLKGEYDVVRNFILHSLQLQSWEKTMDCHSPGQGLMPANFKVRTIPPEGDDAATEEVLTLISERPQSAVSPLSIPGYGGLYCNMRMGKCC